MYALVLKTHLMRHFRPNFQAEDEVNSYQQLIIPNLWKFYTISPTLHLYLLIVLILSPVLMIHIIYYPRRFPLTAS